MDYEGHLREESIESMREAVSRGVNVIMVTGKVGFMYSCMKRCLFMQSEWHLSEVKTSLKLFC